MLERGLACKSLPVYAFFVSRREMEEKMVRLPHVDGYEWVLAEDPTAEAAILKLSPEQLIREVGRLIDPGIADGVQDFRWRKGTAVLD